MGKIGGKDAIEPLMSLLSDKDENIAYFASQGLARLTGQSFGLQQAKWAQWWEENKTKPLPPPVGSQTPRSWWARWRGTAAEEPAPAPAKSETVSAQEKEAAPAPPPPAKSSGGWFSSLFKRSTPPPDSAKPQPTTSPDAGKSAP
jgi:hypothetical protein